MRALMLLLALLSLAATADTLEFDGRTLHYNLSPTEGETDAEAFVALEGTVNRLVHDAVDSFGGSISAEHGLGVLRRDESARYKSDVELALMRTLKTALDPHHLMNPGKVLP